MSIHKRSVEDQPKQQLWNGKWPLLIRSEIQQLMNLRWK